MLAVEVNDMISRSSHSESAKRLRARLAQAATMLTLGTLGCAHPGPGDGDATPSVPGYLEVVMRGPGASRCDSAPLATDGIELRSFDRRSTVTLTAAELSLGRSARRELPAGLYSVTWLSTRSPWDPLAEGWRLHEPVVLGVLPERVTRLDIDWVAGPCPLLARRE